MRWLLISLLGGLLAGCGSSGDYADLDHYMAQQRTKPVGTIDPIPTFQAYRAFSYSAASLRSPFQRPVDVKDLAALEHAGKRVEPDLERTREYLERFSIDALSMVGTIERSGDLWALIRDTDGGVHRVREGNYLGKNHGRIVQIDRVQLAVIEIVPNGGEGWVERPRSIKLDAQD